MSKFGEIKEYLLKNQFTWLITGIAGFIGSNLMEALLKLNQKVVGIDNFITGYQHNIDEVLSSLSKEQEKNFIFYKGDLCLLSDCEKVIEGVDYVLHQAALGSVPRSIKDPLMTNQHNVNGFLNLIWVVKNSKIKRFIYASSSSVYGDSPALPKLEGKTGNLLSPYAISKHTNELYASVFSKCYNIETIGLRYFNVFGARQDPNGAYAAAIPIWMKGLLKGEEVYINGDGETTRDFCYIENVIQANLLAALVDKKDAVNQIYNVAVGEQNSLNALFYTICDLLCIKNRKPIYRDFREGDIRHSLADISKAREKLGYKPTHNLYQGLKESIECYKRFFS